MGGALWGVDERPSARLAWKMDPAYRDVTALTRSMLHCHMIGTEKYGIRIRFQVVIPYLGMTNSRRSVLHRRCRRRRNYIQVMCDRHSAQQRLRMSFEVA